jgi:hypothetical protein
MALQIIQTGVNIATGVASVNSAIPVDSSGVIPRHIRIACTAAAYVRVGAGAQTAVATDMLVQPGDAVVMATLGRNNIAGLQVTAAGVLQVSPVEDI